MIDEFRAAVNDYSVREVGDAVTHLAAFGNEYIQRNEPWKLVDDDPETAEQVIYDCVRIAKAIAVLFEPIAPGKSERLWSQLGEDGSVGEATVAEALDPPAGAFEEPTELYEKIPEERVEELNAKLEARVEAATDDGADEEEGDEPAAGLEPVSDERVSFEAFQELDIRVGEILEVDPIEGADDLVRLEVDIGVETRQIVAGIKQLHDLDALPGTRIVVVANLEKSELFGVESDGMLLAAGEEADLLTTLEDAAPGTKVQ